MRIDFYDGHTRAKIEVRSDHLHIRMTDRDGSSGAVIADPTDVEFVVESIEDLIEYLRRAVRLSSEVRATRH